MSGWRWVAAGAVALNIAVTRTASHLRIGGERVAEQSHGYDNLLTPAAYAAGVCAAMQIAFVVYAVAQLLPAKRRRAGYDELARPLTLAMSLGSAWVVCFHFDHLGLSSLIAMGLLVVAGSMFVTAGESIASHGLGRWAAVPFGILLGWSATTNLANAAAAVAGSSGVPGAVVATIALMIGAGVAGVAVCAGRRAVALPLAVGWTTLLIWASRRADRVSLGIALFVAFAFTVAWALARSRIVRAHPVAVG